MLTYITQAQEEMNNSGFLWLIKFLVRFWPIKSNFLILTHLPTGKLIEHLLLKFLS
jgi:hypothetical protein